MVAFGAVLLACGDSGDSGSDVSPDPSSDTGSEASEVDPERDVSAPGESPSGMLSAPGSAQESPECASAFAACGGLLRGTWILEDTCNGAAHDPAILQSWATAFVDLDPAACPDAVETLTSRWSGSLSFEGGELLDERRRLDSLKLDLTPDCLSSALGVNVSGDNLAGVCAGLGQESARCSSADGVCHCSGEREEASGASGAYGVLGDSVVIASLNGAPGVVAYCVEGDVLHWQEPDSLELLMFRRSPAR